MTTIQNCTVTKNTAKYGGGIWVDTDSSTTTAAAGTATIQNSTISGNVATGAGQSGGGGGVYSWTYGVMTIQNNTITGNSAASRVGGGIELWKDHGTVILDSNTVSGNTSSYGGGIGGRISTDGTATIENSTITGNTATVDGGGLELRSTNGTITVQNSTISGNTAGNQGGGVDFKDYYSITIQNSTITGNTAGGGGGGLYATPFDNGNYSGEPVNIRSVIIAGNTDTSGKAPDLLGVQGVSAVSLANSLVGDNTGSGLTAAPVGSPDSNGNLIGVSSAGLIQNSDRWPITAGRPRRMPCWQAARPSTWAPTRPTSPTTSAAPDSSANWRDRQTSGLTSIKSR